MDLSLYNDEVYSFRHYIHGQFKPADDGSLEFRAATWKDTVWKNKANNGVAFSILSRLFDESWRPGDGYRDGYRSAQPDNR